MDFSIDIEALSRNHDRASFFCGDAALDSYLREQAIQDRTHRAAKCFVAVDNDRSKDKLKDKKRIAGFYTLTATSIPTSSYTAITGKRLRYDKVPLALLGRFAVDLEYQSKGVGIALLSNAIKRAKDADLGIFGLFVEAKDDKSQGWYIRRGFILLDAEARQLILPF